MATNIAPTVTAYNAVMQKNTSIAASSLFKATDANKDTIQHYAVSAAAGGQLFLNGNALTVGQQTVIAASDLANLTYQANNTTGTSLFYVAAYDGTEWSGTTNVSVQRTNTATLPDPVPLNQTLDTNEIVPGAMLFQTPDPASGVVGVRFDVISGTGILRYNASTVISAGNFYTVGNALMGNLQYEAGAVDEQAVIGIRNVDAGGNLSSMRYLTLTIKENTAPTVTKASNYVNGGLTDVKDLIKASDADGDTISQYTLRAFGNSSLYFNGLTYSAGQAISVYADQLQYVKLNANGQSSAQLQVYATDGHTYSSGNNFTFQVDQATIPTVTGNDGTYTFNVTNQLSNMFSVSSGETPTYYRFQNVAGGGQLKLNGVNQGTGQFVVAASSLSLVQYLSNTMGANQIRVSAYTDSGGWSAADYIDMNVV